MPLNSAIEPDCERLLFASAHLGIGAFRLRPENPRFREAGRIRNYVMAFPRRGVWIHREDRAPFVADPSVATIYSPGDPYERHPLAPEGDESEFFSMSEELARDLVMSVAPQSAPRPGASLQPFRLGRVRVSAGLYRAQRELVGALAAPVVDRLAVEERAIRILAAVLRGANEEQGRGAFGRAPSAASRALVERAKELVLSRLFANVSLSELAKTLDVSPFHLCRSFSAVTGSTLQRYRRDVRVRTALELTGAHRGRLSELALSLGFHSHAHFTAAYRAIFGAPPTRTDPDRLA